MPLAPRLADSYFEPVPEPSSSRGLWLILVVALVLRLGWGLMQPGVIDPRLPDQHEYLELAQNLLHQRSLHFFDERFSQDVYAYRTPGYPVFLALCGGSVRVARAVQAILDTSTVLAAFLLARRWLTARYALLSALLVAFNPFLIYFSGLILSETLFTAMLAWGMVLLVRHPNFLQGGIVLVLSILVRPGAILLPLALGIVGVFVTHVKGEMYRRRWYRLPVGASMLLLMMVVLTPWALRNYSILHRFIPLTTNGGITRYDGFNPDATGASDQAFSTSPRMGVLKRLNEVERDEYLNREAAEWTAESWRQGPQQLARLTLNKIARTWSPVPLSEEFGRRRLYLVAAASYSIPFDVLILAGIWFGALPRRVKLFLLLPALYFTLVHAVSVGSLRYRVPVEPVLAVLAGAGAASAAKINVQRATHQRSADVSYHMN